MGQRLVQQTSRNDLIHLAALSSLLLETLERSHDELASESLIADLREFSEATQAKLADVPAQ
jgi:hypothetical protein